MVDASINLLLLCDPLKACLKVYINFCYEMMEFQIQIDPTAYDNTHAIEYWT